MPSLNRSATKSILSAFTVLMLSALAPAFAQMSPGPGAPPTAANPLCPRLEAQLASIDRGGVDPAKADQIRRYEDAANRQQAELDRVTSQARRMGCDSSGFFSLFSGQSAQCSPVNNQIQQMRGNLAQMTSSLEQLRGGGGLGNPDRDNQRRSVLIALAQNNCGPQYASMARSPGGLIDNLFGNSGPVSPLPDQPVQSGGTYRTVCVRSCDGGYFPISFATVPGRFPDDERTCKALCPAADATLFTYPNPGGDINQAVSVNGQPYSSSPNAFKFRTEFNPSCSCKAQGQTWADALKGIDDKSGADGDITVTEERSKKMAQPPPSPGAAKKNSSAASSQPAPAAGPPAPAAGDATGSSDNKQIRSVGPTFIPAR